MSEALSVLRDAKDTLRVFEAAAKKVVTPTPRAWDNDELRQTFIALIGFRLRETEAIDLLNDAYELQGIPTRVTHRQYTHYARRNPDFNTAVAHAKTVAYAEHIRDYAKRVVEEGTLNDHYRLACLLQKEALHALTNAIKVEDSDDAIKLALTDMAVTEQQPMSAAERTRARINARTGDD